MLDCTLVQFHPHLSNFISIPYLHKIKIVKFKAINSKVPQICNNDKRGSFENAANEDTIWILLKKQEEI